MICYACSRQSFHFLRFFSAMIGLCEAGFHGVSLAATNSPMTASRIARSVNAAQ